MQPLKRSDPVFVSPADLAQRGATPALLKQFHTNVPPSGHRVRNGKVEVLYSKYEINKYLRSTR